MIIEYDHNPNITNEQRLQSLKESVQMALNDVETRMQSISASDEEVWETITSTIADFVIEQGTDNDWTYRKWNSGIYEAWRKYQATGLTITSSSAGTYYGASAQLSLPSFNTGVTSATYGNTTSQSSGVYIYNTEPISGNKLNITYRAHASSSNASCGGYFHIIGTWK